MENQDCRKQNNGKLKYDSSSDSEDDEYKYEKNNDSAAIGGQLYETKLVCLFLMRAVRDTKSEFHLGSNLAKIGAIDDVIVRFDYNDLSLKPTILFIQAKHKDNITTIKHKDKINEESIIKSNKIFGLQKYLKSYLLIVNKFNEESEDPVFRGSFEDLDCHLIIYTCHQENFYRPNVRVVQENPFLKTSQDGTAIKFNNIVYDNGVDLIDTLLKSYRYDRAQCVAETFLTYILEDNYYEMMSDNLMAAYHVYLKENIIEISNTVQTDGNNFYRTFKYRDYFFTSNDYFVKIMRDAMLKKVDQHVNYSARIAILKSTPNKLPVQFGNFDIYIQKNKETDIKHISQLLIKLINSADQTTYIVEVNDSNIGSSKIIQEVDMKPHRIGGLVGNLLILDYHTNMLKINSRNLPNTASEILKELKKIKGFKFDFAKYRFDINVRSFPKYSMIHKMHDELFVKSFLNKLTLYCNQAQDTDLNRLIKYEMQDLYSGNDEYFRLKLHILFQNFHYRIQKWWRLRNFMPYYTKTKANILLERCKTSVLESPLMSLVNYVYRNSLRKYSVAFSRDATESLNFINLNENYFISTNSTSLTSIKIIQYLEKDCKLSYLFLDFTYIIAEDYYDCVLKDIATTNLDLLICVIKNYEDDKQIQRVKLLLEEFHGKIIIVTKMNIHSAIVTRTFDKYFYYEDNRNQINDLETYQKMLNETCILFQGAQVSLSVLLEQNTHLVNTYIVKKILNKETIQVGKKIIYKKYFLVNHCYQSPQINCCIKLDYTKYLKNFNIVEETGNIKNEKEFQKERDILVFVKTQDESEKVDAYNRFHGHNVHIFIKEKDYCIWEKSYGKLDRIYHIIERLKPPGDFPDINNLKNTEKRTMIIAAEPGMGKSTLLEYITVSTKAKHQDELILNIVLYDYRNHFLMWENSDIDLEEALIFLFHVFSAHMFQDQSNLQTNKQKINPDIDLKLSSNKKKVFLELRNKTGNELLQFELKIFNQLYNDGKLSVLLDGCDEICPTHLRKFLKLITILDTTRISHLWITTRNYNNVLQKLEETLCTFSHTLYEWSNSEQLSFLKQYFSKSFTINSSDLNKYKCFEEYVQQFQKEISCKIMDNIRRNKFTSIPMHISMIVKIYEDSLKDDFEQVIEKSSTGNIKGIIDTLDLAKLYKKFIDTKFHDSYCVKRPWVDLNDSRMKKSMIRDCEDFVEMHKTFAASVLFSEFSLKLFTENEELKMKIFIDEVESSDEKNGIIDKIVDEKPKFVHLSFAEYFAAEFLCNKLKSRHCTEPVLKFIIDVVMIERKYESIRNFIDCSLSNDTVLGNSYTYYTEKIRELLIQQSSLYMEDSVVTVAIQKPFKNIILFILNVVKNDIDVLLKVVNHRNSLGCLLCTAAEMKCLDVIKAIQNAVLEHDKHNIMKLFECDDSPNNPFIITLFNCKKDFEYTITLDTLLANLEDDDIFKLFMKPYPPINSVCALITMEPETIAFVMKYLKKFNDTQRWEYLKSQDIIGRTAAHYAVDLYKYDYLGIVRDLLNYEQSARIFAITDYNGDTIHDVREKLLLDQHAHI